MLTSGAVLDYDYLIYAVGSTGAVPAAVPGAAEFAYSIADLEKRERLRYALADLHPDAPVTVVGGGLTGIETASELGRAGPAGDPGLRRHAGAVAERARPPFGGQAAAQARRRRAGDPRRSSEVRWDAVVLADGAVLPSAVTVWTAGFGVPELAARSGLRTDDAGPAAHRRDTDQRRRRPHRRRR